MAEAADSSLWRDVQPDGRQGACGLPVPGYGVMPQQGGPGGRGGPQPGRGGRGGRGPGQQNIKFNQQAPNAGTPRGGDGGQPASPPPAKDLLRPPLCVGFTQTREHDW